MTPIQLLLGDVLEQLCQLPSDSVHCVVTSPPYWQVRDYGVTGQLGREETLEEHLKALTRVFAEVRRVLHPWGTCWVNYGDAYAQNGRPATPEELAANHARAAQKSYSSSAFSARTGWERAAGTARGSGLAEKQLLRLPERLAEALQRENWWLRSPVVWHKGNGPSESVRDRPSRDHEMLYLLTKRPRYFYDEFAVRRNMRVEDGWIYGSKLRTVWQIPTTRDNPHRHPASFPPELPKRCILLGSSRLGCCPRCLSPVVPVYQKRPEPDLDAQRRCGGNQSGEYHGQARRDYSATLSQDPSETKRRILAGMRPVRLVGGEPTCDCLTSLAEAIPCTVLDPFSGSGTTGEMALRNGRCYIGIDLNPADIEHQRRTLGPIAEAWMRVRRAGAQHGAHCTGAPT